LCSVEDSYGNDSRSHRFLTILFCLWRILRLPRMIDCHSRRILCWTQLDSSRMTNHAHGFLRISPRDSSLSLRDCLRSGRRTTCQVCFSPDRSRSYGLGCRVSSKGRDLSGLRRPNRSVGEPFRTAKTSEVYRRTQGKKSWWLGCSTNTA
jgi:hypothetical protein